MQNKKIFFLDNLRVLATLSVFFSHVFFLFWSANKVPQDLWQTPTVVWQNPFFASIVSFMGKIKFNFGPFGVALFFLISGFTFLPSVKHSQVIAEDKKLRGGVYSL